MNGIEIDAKVVLCCGVPHKSGMQQAAYGRGEERVKLWKARYAVT
jgi:hypothetical protein